MLGTPFGRPTFLRRAGLSLLPLGAGLSLRPVRGFIGAPAPSAPELIPRRVFYENPEYRNVEISPDARHLPQLAPFDGVPNPCVAPIDAPNDAKPLTRATDREIGFEYGWAFTNRHIVFFRDHDGAGAPPASISRPARSSRCRRIAGSNRSSRNRTTISSRKMRLRHNQRDNRWFDLFRINVVTGKSELVFENRNYCELPTAGHFRLRLGGRVLIGDDFAGSSIRIATGRELVPGLPA